MQLAVEGKLRFLAETVPLGLCLRGYPIFYASGLDSSLWVIKCAVFYVSLSSLRAFFEVRSPRDSRYSSSIAKVGWHQVFLNL